MTTWTFDHRWLRSHRFALIDATQRGSLPKHWQQIVVAPAFLEGDTNRCPSLVDLV
jgi:hypothetical protein